MFPFFTLFGRTIGLYQVTALLGIFSAGIYSCAIAKKNGHNDNDVIIFLLIVSIGVVLGSHLLYAMVNYRYLIDTVQNVYTLNNFPLIIERIKLIFGGSVFYGGLLGGIAAGYFYFLKNKAKYYLIDIVTPAIPLFHFFGRIGCFLAGCCYGIESPFGFTYKHALAEGANGVNRFPIQLLEALINLIIFFILAKNRNSLIFKGKLILFYLLLYSVCRFFLEFVRGDEYRGFISFFSISQWISIICASVSILRILHTRKTTTLKLDSKL
jgi:phosphatidylglycerol:prolipoprotein diacylglycerol transferase